MDLQTIIALRTSLGNLTRFRIPHSTTQVIVLQEDLDRVILQCTQLLAVAEKVKEFPDVHDGRIDNDQHMEAVRDWLVEANLLNRLLGGDA